MVTSWWHLGDVSVTSWWSLKTWHGHVEHAKSSPCDQALCQFSTEKPWSVFLMVDCGYGRDGSLDGGMGEEESAAHVWNTMRHETYDLCFEEICPLVQNMVNMVDDHQQLRWKLMEVDDPPKIRPRGDPGVDPADPQSFAMAKALVESPQTQLAGLYTHGGHSYDAQVGLTWWPWWWSGFGKGMEIYVWRGLLYRMGQRNDFECTWTYYLNIFEHLWTYLNILYHVVSKNLIALQLPYPQGIRSKTQW